MTFHLIDRRTHGLNSKTRQVRAVKTAEIAAHLL